MDRQSIPISDRQSGAVCRTQDISLAYALPSSNLIKGTDGSGEMHALSSLTGHLPRMLQLAPDDTLLKNLWPDRCPMSLVE